MAPHKRTRVADESPDWNCTTDYDLVGVDTGSPHDAMAAAACRGKVRRRGGSNNNSTATTAAATTTTAPGGGGLLMTGKPSHADTMVQLLHRFVASSDDTATDRRIGTLRERLERLTRPEDAYAATVTRATIAELEAAKYRAVRVRAEFKSRIRGVVVARDAAAVAAAPRHRLGGCSDGAPLHATATATVTGGGWCIREYVRRLREEEAALPTAAASSSFAGYPTRQQRRLPPGTATSFADGSIDEKLRLNSAYAIHPNATQMAPCVTTVLRDVVLHDPEFNTFETPRAPVVHQLCDCGGELRRVAQSSTLRCLRCFQEVHSVTDTSVWGEAGRTFHRITERRDRRRKFIVSRNESRETMLHPSVVAPGVTNSRIVHNDAANPQQRYHRFMSAPVRFPGARSRCRACTVGGGTGAVLPGTRSCIHLLFPEGPTTASQEEEEEDEKETETGGAGAAATAPADGDGAAAAAAPPSAGATASLVVPRQRKRQCGPNTLIMSGGALQDAREGEGAAAKRRRRCGTGANAAARPSTADTLTHFNSFLKNMQGHVPPRCATSTFQYQLCYWCYVQNARTPDDITERMVNKSQTYMRTTKVMYQASLPICDRLAGRPTMPFPMEVLHQIRSMYRAMNTLFHLRPYYNQLRRRVPAEQHGGGGGTGGGNMLNFRYIMRIMLQILGLDVYLQKYRVVIRPLTQIALSTVLWVICREFDWEWRECYTEVPMAVMEYYYRTCDQVGAEAMYDAHRVAEDDDGSAASQR